MIFFWVFKDQLIVIVRVWVFCLNICMCTTCVQAGGEEGIGSSGTGL